MSTNLDSANGHICLQAQLPQPGGVSGASLATGVAAAVSMAIVVLVTTVVSMAIAALMTAVVLMAIAVLGTAVDLAGAAS